MIGPSLAVMPAADERFSEGFVGKMSVLIKSKNKREL